MNFYNPYYYSIPTNLTHQKVGLLGRLFGKTGVTISNFLNGTQKADLSDVIRHIDYFLNMSAGKSVGLGSDFDGIEYAPDGLSGVGDLINLETALEKEYGKMQTEMIMHQNMINIIDKI